MRRYLAAPRLATVTTFFNTDGTTDLLGCYAWTQAISARLLPVLGDFEVAFRNSLHTALSTRYGGVASFDWMLPRSAPNPAAPTLPAWHRMNPKMKDDLNTTARKIRQRKGLVTPDDMVAGVTFGFWEQIINNLGHRAHPTGLQTDVLRLVLPFAPDLATCSYSDDAFRMRVVSLLTRIRDARNRVGHHDSIWTLPEFDLQGNLGFIPRRPRHTVTSLRQFLERLCWFIGWVDPRISAYIKQTDHWHLLQNLLSRRTLALYRLHGGEAGITQLVLRTQGRMPSRPISRRGPVARNDIRTKLFIANSYY